MKGGARKKLPFEKKRYLLHVYLTQGYTAAKPIAIKYGIKPSSISKFARLEGHKGKQGREPGVWKKPEPQQPAQGSIVVQVCQEYKIHTNEFFDLNRRGGRLTAARRVALARLRLAGFNRAAAARLLRINYSTVQYWLNPGIREKRKIYMRKYRQSSQAESHA